MRILSLLPNQMARPCNSAAALRDRGPSQRMPRCVLVRSERCVGGGIRGTLGHLGAKRDVLLHVLLDEYDVLFDGV